MPTDSGSAISLEELRNVQSRIGPHIHRTPLLHSRTLSELAGCSVFVKAELFQKTGSYKPRGMLNAVMELPAEQRRRGVLTFSAGNAAQGLAYAASIVGAPATVVMPETASPTKAEATRGYGAEVILHGTPRECFEYSRELAQKDRLAFISSYDDDSLMTGHASLGLEVLDELPDAKSIYVAIGGGGMAGGLARAAEALDSRVNLLGVEPSGAPAMVRSLAENRPVQLEAVDTIADGLAAPSAGALCFQAVKRRFDDVSTVEDADIVAAMKLLMARCKLFVEPAGAAALAGLLSSAGRHEKKEKVVVIVSGGNLDFDRLKTYL